MQMIARAKHYLPDADHDNPDIWGEALWLEQNYFKNMGFAVANGIGRAFSGDDE